MELIDYRGVLRRWSVLIVAGTLVAALIGYRIALRSREAAHPLYAATARVVVNYVTPPGVAYIPTLSLHTQTDVLNARMQDPGLLGRVAGRAHVALSQVQRVSTAVDPQKPLITIQVLGTTPRAAAAVAQGLAQYLAGVETQQVQAQVTSLSRTAARAMAQAQQRWQEAQAYYYLVCNCIAGQYQPQLHKPPTAQRRPRSLSTRPAPQPTRQPRQRPSRQPPPRLTRRPRPQLRTRQSPPRTRRPPRSPSTRPAPRSSRPPLRSPAAAQQTATAMAHQTATAVAQHTASAAAHPTATAVAGSSSVGSHRHGPPDGYRGRPAHGQRRRRNGQRSHSAHGPRRGSPDSHGSSSAGSHPRGSAGGHRGRRQQRSRQPPPQPSRRRPRSPSTRPAPRSSRPPRRSPAAAQQAATATAHQTATAVAQHTASAAEQQTATAVAQQAVAAAAQQTATAAAQQQQMATAVAQQTASAAAQQTATAVAQQAAMAAEQTATTVAQQTVAAAAQQTATAAAQQRATAVAKQTAIAAAQQTAIAAAQHTATAVAQQTASAAAHQTATAVAQQTAMAGDQQTAIAAAEQTAIAAAEQTAIAEAEQTAIAEAEPTATAEAEPTATAEAEPTATVEPGVAYIPTLSLHTQTDVLSARMQDPGLLGRVAGRAHVALSQVQPVRDKGRGLVGQPGVSTAVDPQKPLITIQVLDTTPRAAAAVAHGLVQYLAGVETQQVQAQVASLSRTAASAVAQAQQRWREAQAYYDLVCNCVAGQYQPQLRKPPRPQGTARPLRTPPPQQFRRQPADPATLAQLRAELDLLQADYAAAASRYAALRNNPVPVATVLPGSVSAVQAPAASPVKAVLLATVLGLVLSSGLAMLLDYRRRGLAALARAHGQGHAASPLPDPLFAGAKGGSGSAGRAHAARRDPEPATTLTPGSARPLKAVLLAAGLGLLACIGLAALLLDGWTLPLSVASHVGARHVRLEERRWPQATQPTAPLRALPAPPALLLNPDAVHFSGHDGRARRTAQTIYVVNVGPAPVTIRTITITGADRAAFAEADTCTRSAIGMYGRCTISVRVAPMAGGGSRKATLSPKATLVITANAPGSPQRVPLSA